MVYFPTWKGGRRMEQLRHYFHEDMAVLLEADPEVVRWSARVKPVQVEHDDGEVREFRYSMRAETRSVSRLILLRDEGRRRAIDTGRNRRPSPVASGTVTFEVHTRSDLAGHPRLQASREVLFHRPRDLPRELPLRVAALGAVALPRTLGELHERLGTADIAWEDVVSLVAQGFVEVDMVGAVGPDMAVVTCSPQGYLG